jgi:EAL domain-containing protein (putative c-di-GMP-specific phosphodiesterase class I)
VRISIDDFGTGFSSLSCLRKFPIDVLKIDRSFIQEADERRDIRVMLQTVVSLAHKLGMTVVAEGLETAEQVSYLRSLGCDVGQGYHFSRPLAGEAARELIGRAMPVAAA